MCGIIAGFNTNPTKNKKTKIEKINNYIIDQFQDQRNRGTEGFGIIRIQENGKIEIDRSTNEIKFLLDLYTKPSKMIIAHHRHPTSTSNKINQTHPIYVTNKTLKYDYYVIHNGIIRNDKKLKEKHEKLGFLYTTECYEKNYYSKNETLKFNDSEAIAIETALFIEEQQENIEIENSAAFITLQINKKTQKAEKVYFGRSGYSELNLSIKKGHIEISSEGEGDKVIEDTLWSFNIKDPKMKLTSKGMIFKEKKEEEKTEETETETEIKTIVVTQNNDNNTKSNIVTMEERAWVNNNEIEDPTTEYNTDEYEEEIFVDKNYLEETNNIFKETIKDDDSIMIESSLDTEIDAQIERINRMIENFKNIVLIRKIDKTEKSWYMGQIWKVLSTVEKITDTAEEDYKEKILKEEEEEEEEKRENGTKYSTHQHTIGFRAGHRVHDEDYENETGKLDFNNFG